jgi:hypothetical protein
VLKLPSPLALAWLPVAVLKLKSPLALALHPIAVLVPTPLALARVPQATLLPAVAVAPSASLCDEIGAQELRRGRRRPEADDERQAERGDGRA